MEDAPTMSAISLSLIATAILLLFSSNTEQFRVVAIQRPMVITQERRSPAYYVYKQSQDAQAAKKIEASPSANTYLSRFSIKPAETQVVANEMKFSRAEVLAYLEQQYRNQNANGLRRPASELHISSSLAELTASSAPTMVTTPTQAEETTLSPEQKWATVRGNFELKDGVAILDHEIEIRRVEEGQTKEIGKIDLNTGTYSIDIQSPDGYLIAQIKDKNGLLVGEDRQRLINLQSHGSYLEGPYIRVGNPPSLGANIADAGTPTVATASKTTMSKTIAKTDASSGSLKSLSVSIFDNQNTLDSAGGVFTNVSTYSSTISRLFDASRVYANMVTIRHTGETSQTPLFTRNWLAGVVSYISDTQKIEFKSQTAPVIIGRVLQDGKPVAGAQVALSGAPGMAPIYLDQFMIPNFSLSTTSDNGYFIFAGVDAGAYTAVVTKNNLNIGAQLFVAEDDSIAFQNIEGLSIPQNKIVRVYDALNSTPLGADVFSTETPDVIEVPEGTQLYQTRTQYAVSEFLARPRDRRYRAVYYVQNAHQEYVHIPLVSEDWVSGLKAQAHIGDVAGVGTVIGFTQNLQYDAYLAADNYDARNIVYFDSNGSLSSAPTLGGGFILFNVPVGAKEVILQDKLSDRIYSQVINVQLAQTSVTHFADE